ncbi:hypothetical protein [Labilithrix luteola]|uniref:hypothetical protein n=1 Tax=Labilithrix luteola TaxID=1391654 RepID=UPI0011BAC8BF|nr:hypothetical protein [Labilithrix luteola]
MRRAPDCRVSQLKRWALALLWGPPAMLALPHLLGTECIATLTTMGFHVMARNAGRETLQRDSVVVIVPKTALAPAVVAGLLRAAGVDPFEFLRALEQQQRPRTLSQGASQDTPNESAPRGRLTAARLGPTRASTVAPLCVVASRKASRSA